MVGALAFCSVHVGIARAVVDGDTGAPARTERWASILAGFGVLFAISIWFFIPAAWTVGAFTPAVAAFSVAGGALVALNLVILRTIQALGDSRSFRNGWLMQALVYPALGIPAAALTRHPLLVAACWLFAVLASTLMGRLRTRRPRELESQPRPGATRRIIVESLPAHAAVMGQQMLLRADIVVLGALSMSTSVGYYSVASAIAGLVSVVAEVGSLFVLQRGMQPDQKSSKSSLLKSVYRFYAPVSMCVAILIGGAALAFIPMVLPDYTPAIVLVLVLLPGAFVQGFARIALAVLSTERVSRLLVGFGIANIVLASSYVPAVMIGNAMGAAITSTVLYFVQAIMTVAIVAPLLRRLDKNRSESMLVIASEESTNGQG